MWERISDSEMAMMKFIEVYNYRDRANFNGWSISYLACRGIYFIHMYHIELPYIVTIVEHPK
jgi:hypothetical protein